MYMYVNKPIETQAAGWCGPNPKGGRGKINCVTN